MKTDTSCACQLESVLCFFSAQQDSEITNQTFPIILCSQLTSLRQNIFRKTFRQMFLWPHQLQKTNDKKSNLCCMKNVIVRQTLT